MAGLNREMLEFLFVGPLFSIFKKLNAIERNQKDMATQAEVNALTEKVGAVSAQLVTTGAQLGKGLEEVKAEIQRLKDANPALDLGALGAQVDGLVTVAGGLAPTAQALDDVVPDVTPEPEPEPVPEPEPTPEPEPVTPEDV